MVRTTADDNIRFGSNLMSYFLRAPQLWIACERRYEADMKAAPLALRSKISCHVDCFVLCRKKTFLVSCFSSIDSISEWTIGRVLKQKKGVSGSPYSDLSDRRAKVNVVNEPIDGYCDGCHLMTLFLRNKAWSLHTSHSLPTG